MSGKKIDVQAGGKWAKFDDGSGMVHRQADGRVRLLGKYGIDAIISETSISGKLFDLPTPDALAQLREWGYVVTGDELVTQTITPSGMVIETRYVFPGEFKIDPPITEARVMEIVAQMLAAHPTPAEVREAAKVAGDPKTEWHNITTKIVDPKVAVAPEPVRWSDIYNTPHSLRVAIDGPIMAVSPAWSGERVVIMDVPANIAATEPDWKGLLANVVEAWKQSYFSGTEAVDRVVNFNTSPALAAAREHLARTNGGGK